MEPRKSFVPTDVLHSIPADSDSDFLHLFLFLRLIKFSQLFMCVPSRTIKILECGLVNLGQFGQPKVPKLIGPVSNSVGPTGLWAAMLNNFIFFISQKVYNHLSLLFHFILQLTFQKNIYVCEVCEC